MSQLSELERKRIEDNRKRALEKKALRDKIEENRLKALRIQTIRREESRTRSHDHYRPPLSSFKIDSPSSVTFTDENMLESPIIVGNHSDSFSPASYDKGTAPIDDGLLSASVSGINGMREKQSRSPNLKKVTGFCRMISKDRFLVDAQYHQQMLGIFKTVKSALYDSMSKRWSFHLEDHENLIRELQSLKDASISSLPKFVLNAFRKPPITLQNVDLSTIDSELLKKLMPFQRDGVKFGISRQGRCLIADDMGLGKTIQALGIAHYYVSDWPLIVVCPTSVRYQWQEAFFLWLPSIPRYEITVMTSAKEFDIDAKVLIISYNLLSRNINTVSKLKYGVIILDESHFMKSNTSARTKSACTIIQRSKRVILLSGTPALSRPIELFTQLNAIDPRTFASFRDFGIRYCAGKVSPLGFWDYSGSSNMEELQLLLEKSFMIRRLKRDVIAELPSKIRQVVVLNSTDIKRSHEMMEFEENLQSNQLKGIDRHGTLLQYYASSSKCKLPAILDYVNDQLESSKKFIIFAHHKHILDNICKSIAKKNIEFIRIDGTTASLCRKEYCDKFQLNSSCMVAVLSITAANAGITLTAAQLVIFAELFWNPGILTQAEDRAHRIGQKDCVIVQYLVARNTADDYLWPLIQSKLNVLNKAGLSKDNFGNCDTSVANINNCSQKSIKDFFGDLNIYFDDDNDDFFSGNSEFCE